jgi:hypothetical protein
MELELSYEVNNMITDYWLFNMDIKLGALTRIIKKQIELGARDEDIEWLLTGKPQPQLRAFCYINKKWNQIWIYPDEFKNYRYLGRQVSNIPVFELI